MDEDWWEDAQQDLDHEEEHDIDCDCAYCEDRKND